MKTARLILPILLFILSFGSLYSQDDRLDNFTFESEPLKHESIPYFAVAGGYTGTFTFLNYDEINNQLNAGNFGVGTFDGPLYLNGAEGFTGVFIVPALRAGFFSYGGTKKLSKTDTFNGVPNLERDVQLSVGYTGIALEYGIVLFKSFAILPGVGFGWGNMSLEATQTEQNADWGNFNPNPEANNYMKRIESSYLFVKPNLNIEYSILNILMFRLNATYMLPFSYDWKYNHAATLNNVPDGVAAKGFAVQVGLFVGLFNY